MNTFLGARHYNCFHFLVETLFLGGGASYGIVGKLPPKDEKGSKRMD